MSRKLYIEIDESDARCFMGEFGEKGHHEGEQKLKALVREALLERDPRFTGQFFEINELLWENYDPSITLCLGLNVSSAPGYAAFFQHKDGSWNKVGEVQAIQPSMREMEERESFQDRRFKGQPGISELLSGVDPGEAFKMARYHEGEKFSTHGADDATLEPAERRNEQSLSDTRADLRVEESGTDGERLLEISRQVSKAWGEYFTTLVNATKRILDENPELKKLIESQQVISAGPEDYMGK